MKLKTTFLFSFLFLFSVKNFAQDKVVSANSSPAESRKTKTENNKNDTSVIIKKHSPRKATIRSALLPGWGQIYNKKYWKLPLVYGALGTTAGVFAYNIKWYNRTRYAYKIAYQIQSGMGNTGMDEVYPELKPLLTQPEALKQYRNEFRQNVDYSVLFFLLAWGLNVVDATVDGHLKDFDVGNDLSIKINPGYSPLANTTGLSLIVALGKNKSSKALTSLR
ncbi:MAG TPA: DUF5683 domain-containing protein [Chitinophagaceae bacterium]|nr:DUF5683 domain-containing protein [Chitinophagaceae bacterium]